MRRPVLLLTIPLLLAGCALRQTAPAHEEDPMKRIAESYVKLVLAVGQHDTDYVDAYYGPPELRTEAEAHKRPLPEIRSAAEALIANLAAIRRRPATRRSSASAINISSGSSSRWWRGSTSSPASGCPSTRSR